MNPSGPLSSALLAGAGGRAGVPDDLEPRLVELAARARAAWPEVELPAPDFVAHLAERLPAGRPLDAALEGVHVEDLYLACACARGDRAALRIFEERYLQALPAALRRVERSAAAIDDACQALRERLLVGAHGERPRILDYAGLGSLKGWLGVAAMRLALNQKRGTVHQQLHERHLERAAPSLDPELQYLKERYRVEFAAAFQEAIASLDPKARTILRLHYLDGLNIDRIGTLHRVHRATVARWIAGYCRAVQEAARQHLMRVLRASPAELDSLERLVESQLELSLRRALGDEPAVGPQ